MSHHRPSAGPDSDLEDSHDEEEDELTFGDMVDQTVAEKDLEEMYEDVDGL